jgi:hypothetical protein
MIPYHTAAIAKHEVAVHALACKVLEHREAATDAERSGAARRRAQGC